MSQPIGQQINMGFLLTNHKLPSIHSESVPRGRPKARTYSYAEKNGVRTTGAIFGEELSSFTIMFSELRPFQNQLNYCFQQLVNCNATLITFRDRPLSTLPVDVSMGESNTVVSAYSMYRHLQQYCSHPSSMLPLIKQSFILVTLRKSF